jgi:hypothetical protein
MVSSMLRCGEGEGDEDPEEDVGVVDESGGEGDPSSESDRAGDGGVWMRVTEPDPTPASEAGSRGSEEGLFRPRRRPRISWSSFVQASRVSYFTGSTTRSSICVKLFHVKPRKRKLEASSRASITRNLTLNTAAQSQAGITCKGDGIEG